MFEVTAVARHTDRTMAVERVASAIGRYVYRSGLSVKPGIGGITADRGVGVPARSRR